MSGGYYELAIELDPGQSAAPALEALWAYRALDGPDEDEPAADVSRVLSGVAHLRDGARVPCISHVLSPNTLVFSVPVNGLRAVWPHIGDFPFEDAAGAQEWQEPLEEWFADIGRAVFATVPFPVARVGFEIAFDREWTDTVPDERWEGVLHREDDELRWYPTTTWGGPIGVRWEDLTDVTPLRTRLGRWLRGGPR